MEKLNRLRGLAVLAALSALGYGLSLLKEVGRPLVRVTRVQGRGDRTVILAVDERREARGWPFSPQVRLVLASKPAEIDPTRSVIHLLPGGRLVAPPTWPTVLVGRDGQLRRHPLELEYSQAVLIRQQAERAGSGETAFAAVRSKLEELDPTLRSFWRG